MVKDGTTKQKAIEMTAQYVKAKLSGETTGHDWFHVYRVWRNAITIGKVEKADMFVVQLAALLHDIADWKMNDVDSKIGPKKAKEWLESLKVDPKTIQHVCDIIQDMTFKGAASKSKIKTKEGMIVQDADRLDAMGAIGIARTFASGQKFGQEIYNPNIKPLINLTAKSYGKQYTGERKNTSINHFYEKLLLIKDRMNTRTARKIAKQRHDFMEEYLKRFYKEWDGKS
ncbi:MAG: HD domain-containing protein [Candidatus Micrarchaeaceae archaeon]|jgi:uncharacterized protein